MWRVLLVLVMLCTSAHSEEGNPRESQHKIEAGRSEDQYGTPSQRITVPANGASPIIINVFTGRHPGEESQCAAPKEWKELAAFALCKTNDWFDAERTIAIFTVILAIATGFLWWATRALVKGADQTAERQLRAYVFVGAHKAPSLEAGAIPELELYVKNVGQTPANNVQHWTTMGILPFPMRAAPPGPDPLHTMIRAFLPTQGDFQAIHYGNPPLDAATVATIKDGSEYRLYVWGEVRYIDIFNVKRTTKFRFMQGGKNFRPGQLEICEDGNEAT